VTTPDAAAASALEEYKTLRDETFRRIEARNQISNYTLTFAAAMFTLGLGRDGYRAALLVYPIVSFFFSVAFAYNSLMLIEIGAYLRGLERRGLGRSGWAEHLKDRYRSIEPFEVVATSGLFVVTQAVAIGLFVLGMHNPSDVEKTLMGIASGALLLTIASIAYPVVYHRRALGARAAGRQ